MSDMLSLTMLLGVTLATIALAVWDDRRSRRESTVNGSGQRDENNRH